jgi:hypothetical protein
MQDPTQPAQEQAIELLPCPFCGSANIECAITIVDCRDCGAQADNAQIWNRRVTPTNAPSEGQTGEVATRVLEYDALATPGPWRFDNPDDSFSMNLYCVQQEGSPEPEDESDLLNVVAVTLLQVGPTQICIKDKLWEENAQLIAYYRTAAPNLARELITLHASHSTLEAQLAAMRSLIHELVERRSDPLGFYYTSKNLAGLGSELSHRVEAVLTGTSGQALLDRLKVAEEDSKRLDKLVRIKDGTIDWNNGDGPNSITWATFTRGLSLGKAKFDLDTGHLLDEEVPILTLREAIDAIPDEAIASAMRKDGHE